MRKVIEYAGCFVCGMENEGGLNVEFFDDGQEVQADFVPQSRFQGYENILHGGITSALLDEAMIKAILAEGILAVTAEMRVKFRKPVRVGDHVKVVGRIERCKRKVITTSGEMVRGGEVVAQAWGKYVKIEKGGEIG